MKLIPLWLGSTLVNGLSAGVKEVFCPCRADYLCTNKNGDIIDECSNNHTCTEPDALYEHVHDFTHDAEQGIRTTVTAAQAKKGGHCRLELSYLLPNGVKHHDFRRLILNNVEMMSYGLSVARDECQNVEHVRSMLQTHEFFIGAQSQDEDKLEVCCPTRQTWLKYKHENKILDSEGNITEEYQREFEKCSEPDFVDLGLDSAKHWFNTLPLPFYQRTRFRLICALSSLCVLSVVTLAVCIRRARRRIDHNQEHMLTLLSGDDSTPHFYTNESNLLGQGGGGRVYEGKFDGIDVAIKKILEWDNQSRFISLRNECIIQHAFKHDYILDIFYPPLPAIVQPNKRIETIVVAKYGWGTNNADNGRERRNLFDLLIELKDQTQQGEWSQHKANTVAWDIAKSLVKGIQNLHEARTAVANGHNYAAQFSCVVHRDIKLKNIGIKTNADGHFYAIIADYGLSAVLLKPDTRIQHSSRIDLWRRMINFKRMPKWLDFVKYLIGVPQTAVDDEVLSVIKDCENTAIRNFLIGCACGTDHWLAPEIDKHRRSAYYFTLDDNYNCKRCFDRRNKTGKKYAAGFQRADVCRQCREQIFEFYRKNDIYSMGLVLWSILKAVIGSFSGFHTDSETGIASYLEHPLDVTTSHDCQSSRDTAETGDIVVNTDALLVAEVARESRLAEIVKIGDKRIEKIRQLAEMCLNPNPFERPAAAVLYDEVEQLNIDMERENNH